MPALPSQPATHSANSGYSLAELLIGSVLVAIAVAGAASLLISGTSTRNRSATIDRQEALIDADIARMQELSRRYTWCSGAATFNGANCNGVGPSNENYYFTDLNEAALEECDEDAGCTAFRDHCNNLDVDTTLLGPLVDEIPLQVPGAELAADTPAINRVIAVDDAEQHRLRITYTNATNTVTRVFTLVPPVANWCPS